MDKLLSMPILSLISHVSVISILEVVLRIEYISFMKYIHSYSRAIVHESFIQQGTLTPGSQGQVGTGQHIRRWEVDSEFYLPFPITPHHSHYCVHFHPHPGQWKNCLSLNQSPVPKSLGTAVIGHCRITYISPPLPEEKVKVLVTQLCLTLCDPHGL